MLKSPATAVAAVALCTAFSTGLVSPVVAHAAAPKTSTAWSTANLNVRSGPGTSFAVIGGLRPGARVTVVSTAKGWTTILYGGKPAYVAASYLRGSSPGEPTTPTVPTKPTTPGKPSTPPVKGGLVTTANVNGRSGPSLDDVVVTVVRRGTAVVATGTVTNRFAKVIVAGRTLWVHTTYLRKADATTPVPTPAPAPQGPKVPSQPDTPTAGTRYAKVGLNIRSQPSMSADLVGFYPQGAAVQVTGVTEGAWTQVHYAKTTRWVATAYLSTTAQTPSPSTPPPSVGLPGITATARYAYGDIRAAFPEVKTVYGLRAGTGSDHNVGKALDFMISGYRYDSSVGDRLALYVLANAERLDVKYIIWEQRIYYVAHPERGWRFMADRGNDTVNHYDHVHVSFNH